MKSFILIITIIFSLSACKKDSPCGCDPSPETCAITVMYFDKEGNSLLDENQDFMLGDVKILHWIDNKYVVSNQINSKKNQDNPHSFSSGIDQDSNTVIAAWPYRSGENKTKMILQTKTRSDTFHVEFDPTFDHGTRCLEVKYKQAVLENNSIKITVE